MLDPINFTKQGADHVPLPLDGLMVQQRNGVVATIMRLNRPATTEAAVRAEPEALEMDSWSEDMQQRADRLARKRLEVEGGGIKIVIGTAVQRPNFWLRFRASFPICSVAANKLLSIPSALQQQSATGPHGGAHTPPSVTDSEYT